MSQQVETTGRSVEDALRTALAALGAKPAEVRVEVLDNASSGFLGLFGQRPARIRVERLVAKHADLRELTISLLASMGIPATVEVRASESGTEIGIRTEAMDGLLIGRRGQTLAALHHVLGRLAAREFGAEVRIGVDVGAYRQRREAQLADKARVLAEKVRTTGREVTLEPLHATDRRVVHQAITAVSGVRAYTVGQGLHRNVVIAPEDRTD
jgi:spoIIIJ-associated protein